MTYSAALSLSWAMTWRLALAHLVLLLILLLVLIAFVGPIRGRQPLVLGVSDALLAWLFAWPFVIRRVLAPQALLPKVQGLRVRYSIAAVFGFVCDLLSLAPVTLVLLLTRSLAAIVPVFLLTRTFLVLPSGIQRLSRELRQIP